VRTTFNDDEFSALEGLPLAARVLYMCGIRPYMDYMTGIVGIKRGISLQSLVESLYVEPNRGYESPTFSKDQVFRITNRLIKVGLLERRSIAKEKLIFFLPLADRNESVQKQAATKPRP
jgi:hypothetical protein